MLGIGPAASELRLKDEIARELLEADGEDRDRRPAPAAEGDRDGDREPDFLVDGETEADILTGGAGEDG